MYLFIRFSKTCIVKKKRNKYFNSNKIINNCFRSCAKKKGNKKSLYNQVTLL